MEELDLLVLLLQELLHFDLELSGFFLLLELVVFELLVLLAKTAQMFLREEDSLVFGLQLFPLFFHLPS